jgi:hypothetical protein
MEGRERTDGPDSNKKPVPGMLVVFMVSRTAMDLSAASDVETPTLKSAPSYPDVIPKQKIIKQEFREVGGMETGFLVKAYLPGIVIAEATVELDDILSPRSLDLRRRLTGECRRVLDEFDCHRDFDEEYSVFCIAGYSGDPEVYLSLYGDRIAAFLKNEDFPLDEEEVKSTLATSLKYGKDDITIVDWDGAFIFDAEGDFRSDIELFEIANLQLLRSRMLDNQLDKRLEKTLSRLHAPGRPPLLKSREVRNVLREIIEIRTQSILESEAVDHNIKLIGDWYSARLYSLIAKKFHLDAWASDIKEKLQTLEDVYTMAAENFSLSYRATIEFVILGGWFLLLILYIFEFFLTKK